MTDTRPFDEDDSRASAFARSEIVEQDWAFISAMKQAILDGLERPDRVGISQVPGTRNPMFVKRGSVGVFG